jgi:hypothetical protein
MRQATGNGTNVQQKAIMWCLIISTCVIMEVRLPLQRCAPPACPMLT